MKSERGLELDGDLTILARWYDLRASNIVVSPDSRFALTFRGTRVGQAALLPLTGGPVRHPAFAHDVQSISFTPDGIAVLGGTGAGIAFWDVDQDAVLYRHDASHVLRHLDERSFLAVRYTTARPRIQRWVRGAASPERDRELRLGRETQHDPDKTGPEATWEIEKDETPVVATAQGRVVTCKSEVSEGGGTDTALFEWDLDSGTSRRLRTFATDFGPGDSLHALPKNRFLARKWWGEKWLALWDFERETELWRLPLELSCSAFAVDASGERAAIVLSEGRIQIRDTLDGKILVGARIVPHRFLGVDALAFTPDGRLLLALDDGIVAMIDVP